MSIVVDCERVAREAEDGDAHQQGQRRRGHSGIVHDAERAHLGLEVEIARLDLEVGRLSLIHFDVGMPERCSRLCSGVSKWEGKKMKRDTNQKETEPTSN